MLEFSELDNLSAANDSCDPGAKVVDHPAVLWARGMVRRAFDACDLEWSFPSLDRLKKAKHRQLEILFANPSSASRDVVLRHAERVLFQGLGAGIECGAYDASFLESYNAWAAKLLNFLRSSPDPLPKALTVFDRDSASLEFEFEHDVEHLFGTVQQEAIRQILDDPNIALRFLADYFDDQFLSLFEPLSEAAFSYAKSLESRWFEWCYKVVPLVHDWIEGNDANGLDVLRGRLQLSLVV